jgi:hypothetical protein
MPDSDRCWSHHPDYEQARRRRASKGGLRGGRGRTSEMGELKAQLRELAEKVLTGQVETGRAAVAGQLYNALLRAIETTRKIREQEEVLARLDALETRQSLQGSEPGRARWGG